MDHVSFGENGIEYVIDSIGTDHSKVRMNGIMGVYRTRLLEAYGCWASTQKFVALYVDCQKYYRLKIENFIKFVTPFVTVTKEDVHDFWWVIFPTADVGLYWQQWMKEHAIIYEKKSHLDKENKMVENLAVILDLGQDVNAWSFDLKGSFTEKFIEEVFVPWLKERREEGQDGTKRT